MAILEYPDRFEDPNNRFWVVSGNNEVRPVKIKTVTRYFDTGEVEVGVEDLMTPRTIHRVKLIEIYDTSEAAVKGLADYTIEKVEGINAELALQ